MPNINHRADEAYNVVRCEAHKEAIDEIQRWIKAHCAEYRDLSVQMAELEREIAHEREVREREFTARDKELVLQNSRDAVHFESLNNNLSRVLAERGIYFTSKEHEAFAEQFRHFRDETRQHQTTVVTWGAAALVALGLIEFGLRFLLPVK